MNASRSHVDAVMQVVGNQAIVANDDDVGVIHRSWIRCYQDYRLDPAGRCRMRVESSTLLRQRREQHERYLRAARAGMEQLYRHVADLGYVLMLADAEGVTLDFLGGGDPDSPLRDGLVIGADWNELYAGTNGIGTCVAERRTLTCHREDHFYAGNLDLSCTATPLFEGVVMAAVERELPGPDRKWPPLEVPQEPEPPAAPQEPPPQADPYLDCKELRPSIPTRRVLVARG